MKWTYFSGLWSGFWLGLMTGFGLCQVVAEKYQIAPLLLNAYMSLIVYPICMFLILMPRIIVEMARQMAKGIKQYRAVTAKSSGGGEG